MTSLYVLNWTLKTQTLCYIEKYKSDLDTWPIDRVLSI